MTKFPGLAKFVDLDGDFWVETLMSRQCQDVDIESLDRDMINAKRDPQAYIFKMGILYIYCSFVPIIFGNSDV
jgi:hypothetical protein